MATKHMVICKECGRQFNANYGHGYNSKSRRYVCPRCMREIESNRRLYTTGMKQSKVAMILKIVFGLLFIGAGFSSPEGGWSVGYFFTALVIGGALLAWGLVPYFKAKKQKQEEDDLLQQAEEELANEVKKCPACGAMSKGNFCEYCGSRLK